MPAPRLPHLPLLACTLILLSACTPPAAPTEPVALRSQAIGQLNVTVSLLRQPEVTDSSGTLRFTPTVVTDVNDIPNGTRYLSVTGSVRNLSGQPLSNVTFRAVQLPDASGDSALTDVRGAPTTAEPDGPPVTDAALLAGFRPVHRTVLGAFRPEIDGRGASFQAYRPAESAALQAQVQASLPVGATVLDYGFVTTGVDGRTIPPGGSAPISVAMRFPARSELPKVSGFTVSLMAVQDDAVRVSQALGETQAQALTRAQATQGAGQSTQLALTDGQAAGVSAPTVTTITLGAVRTGTHTTLR